jgi:hypothetical protein
MPGICSVTDGDGKQDAGLRVQQDEWRPKMAGGERHADDDRVASSGVS